MKKLNKESLQQFMLLHAEKLILGVCLGLTGFVIWMSLGPKAELDKKPQQLLTEANSAEATINADNAWDKLSTFRQGNLEAKKQIVDSAMVDAQLFVLGNFRGSPAAALASRTDPEIYAPQQLVATRLSTALLMEFPNQQSAIDRFVAAPIASDGKKEDDSDGGLGFGAMEGPPGGDGLGFGLDGTGDDDDEKKKRRDEEEEAAVPELEHHSGQLYEVNTKIAGQLRPSKFGLSPTTIKSAVFDVVCVTAVVDYKKQVEQFNEALANSVAYFPDRDRPIYQFLQVQRRELRGDQAGEWEDRSEFISYLFPGKFPKNLHKMPQKLFPTAPEVVAPENWDPIITGNIPAFAMQPYEDFCLHPSLSKKRAFPDREEEKEMGDIKDLNIEGPGKDDIFNPSFGQSGDGAGAPGGMDGGSGMGLGGVGLGGVGLGGDETQSANFRRRGSVMKDYEEALLEKEAKDQFKLVRFFDLRAPRNKSFEYRVRVWVGDPNHEDPNKGFTSKRGSILNKNGQSGGSLGGMDGGMGLGGMDGGMGLGGMDGGMGLGGMGLGGMDGEDGDEEKETYTYRKIVSSMLSPAVRKRLSLATKDDVVQKNPTDRFFVTEFFDEAKKEPTKVELPPSDQKFAYIQYLRYSRPSKWSEPVKVDSTPVSSRLVAGSAIKGRSISIDTGSGTADFDLEEISVDVVAAAWSSSIGAEIQALKKVFVGETLNFNSPSYVLHPVNWRWVVAENPNASPKSKYIVPIRTNQTIVDAIAGETLDLPDSRKKAYETPTEILVMDSLGNLVIANEFEQERDFRFLNATPDESRFIGRRKKKKKSADEFDLMNGPNF
jgi:hypothetical protein